MRRVVLPVALCLSVIPAAAQNCQQLLGQQKPDAASIKKVEHGWMDAYLHGGTDYLNCLLLEDYVSVSWKGVPRDKAEIMEMARKNAGNQTADTKTADKNAPKPKLPEPKIRIYGNTAVVHSQAAADPNGKYPAMYSADVFTFQDGAWHAVYSQHTNIQADDRSK
jgi:uncharacterized protein DUF4440